MIAALYVIAIGALSIALTFFLLYKTYLALGTFGIFAGGKARFSGIANAKYTKNSVSLSDCKNLNGRTIRVIKVKKDKNYTIQCKIKVDKGTANVILKDLKKNEILRSNSNESIEYKVDYDGKIFVQLEFDRFYGDIICNVDEK